MFLFSQSITQFVWRMLEANWCKFLSYCSVLSILYFSESIMNVYNITFYGYLMEGIFSLNSPH